MSVPRRSMQAMSENTIVKGDVGDVWGMAAEDRRLSLYMAVSMACVISSLVCGEMLCNVTRTDLEESLSSSCLFLFDMVNPWQRSTPCFGQQDSTRTQELKRRITCCWHSQDRAN